MRSKTQILKRTAYSIEAFGGKTDLVLRGLMDLKLFKETKPDPSSIFHICQFCGRIISSTWGSCNFCGHRPKSIKESAVAQVLSNRAFGLKQLLQISKLIKRGMDLEISIPRFREKIEKDMGDSTKETIYRARLGLAEKKSEDSQDEDVVDIPCPLCCVQMTITNYCFAHSKGQFNMSGYLTGKDNWIIALNNLLIFLEESLDNFENENAMNKLIAHAILMLAWRNAKMTQKLQQVRWSNTFEKLMGTSYRLHSIDSEIARKRLKSFLRRVSLFSSAVGQVQIKEDTVMLGNKFFPVWSCCCGEYMTTRYVGIICDKCGCEVKQRDYVTDRKLLNYFSRRPSGYNEMKRGVGQHRFIGRFEKRMKSGYTSYVPMDPPYDSKLDFRLACLVLNLSYLIKSST